MHGCQERSSAPEALQLLPCAYRRQGRLRLRARQKRLGRRQPLQYVYFYIGSYSGVHLLGGTKLFRKEKRCTNKKYARNRQHVNIFDFRLV